MEKKEVKRRRNKQYGGVQTGVDFPELMMSLKLKDACIYLYRDLRLSEGWKQVGCYIRVYVHLRITETENLLDVNGFQLLL